MSSGERWRFGWLLSAFVLASLPARRASADTNADAEPAVADAGVAPDSQSSETGPPEAPVPVDEVPRSDVPLPEVSEAPKRLGLSPLQFHGFVSQGALRGTGNNYLVDSKRGSVAFSEVGLNVTQVFSDNLRAGAQLFARRLGNDGNFAAQFDWFYLDYRFADWLGLRAGRTKVPFGLYNEINDVDSARVPVLLPQAVYPILNRTLLLAQTGFELYGYVRMGLAGGLEYRVYGGTLFADAPAAPAGTTTKDFKIPYIVGGRLMWDTPLEGLRLGGSVQALRVEQRFNLPAPAGMTPAILALNIPFVLWLGSLEFTRNGLTLAGEYGRWRADLELTGLPTSRVVNERYYGMAAYRFTHWFSPGVYYSSLLTDVHKPKTRDNYQRDFAATLRFDLTANWLVKLEGHIIEGTTELNPALNDDMPKAMMRNMWTLFLAKTTVYF